MSSAEVLDSSPRFYKREWTGHRLPRLPKSTSLPVFRLLPTDRSIFTCLQCGFINTLVPLCLWCCWTSEEAERDFENLMPRPRRASTPAKIIWQYPCQDALYVGPQTGSTNGKHSQHLDFETDHSDSWSIVAGPPAPHADVNVVRASSQHEKAFPLGAAQNSAWSDDFNTDSPSTDANSPNTFHYPACTQLPQRNPIPLMKSISKQSLQPTHIVIDLKALRGSCVEPLPSFDKRLAKHAPDTPRTLRRKQRLSLLRLSAPASDSRTSSASSSNGKLPTKPTPLQSVSPVNHDLADNQIPNHARSHSHPNNSVRLGHPSRPLYSAIRPNMSPVNSSFTPPTTTPAPPLRLPRPLSLPISIRTSLRPSSPGIVSVLSESALQDNDDDEEPLSGISLFRPRALSHPDRRRSVQQLPSWSPLSRHSQGFSLSGETELRMTLADMGNADVKDEFKFKDMGRRRGSFYAVVKKMRELKRGLKEFVLGGGHHHLFTE